MAERESFNFDTFGGSSFGIMATDTVAAEAAAAFLDSDPKEISEIKEEDQEHPKKQESKKQPPTKQAPAKQQAAPQEGEKEDGDKKDKKPTQEEILKILSGDTSEEDEETEEEGNKPKDQKPEEGEETEEQPENTFVTLSKELAELGIFRKDAEEDDEALIANNGEELLERFNYEKRRDAGEILETFLSRFGQDYKDMFDNVFVKGLDPQDYLQKFTKIQSVEGLDLASVDNQERVVRENLRREGYPAAAIDSKVEKMKQYADLEEEAKLAHQILLKREKEDLSKEIENKEQQLVARKQERAGFVNSISKILQEKVEKKEFDGIPIDAATANSVGAYLTQEKYQTPKGELLTEYDKDFLDLNRPENHAMKVKVALLMQLLKTDPTLSKIGKKAVSQKSNQIFSKLAEKDKKSSGNKVGDNKSSGSKKEDVSSWF